MTSIKIVSTYSSMHVVLLFKDGSGHDKLIPLLCSQGNKKNLKLLLYQN